MIDIHKEKLLTLAEAARHPSLPRRRQGKRPHVSSIYRYAKTGIRGVRLETVRFAGSLCTTEQALQRFCDRLSRTDFEAVVGDVPSPTKSSDRAAQKLSEQGI